jgi:hypothetical protein
MSTHRTARRGRLYSPREHESRQRDELERRAGRRWSQYRDVAGFAELVDERPRQTAAQPPAEAVSCHTPPAGTSGRDAGLQLTSGGTGADPSGLSGPCAADRTCRFADRVGIRGQAIVEFALVFPIIAAILLGAAEMGMLYAARAAQDRAGGVVADYAAARPGDESWNAVADRELPGCDVDVTTDGLGILTARATCQYEPVITSNLWDGLPISSEASAAIAPEPTPSASPDPSASTAP